jgi:hypothetical protein
LSNYPASITIIDPLRIPAHAGQQASPHYPDVALANKDVALAEQSIALKEHTTTLVEQAAFIAELRAQLGKDK